MEREGEGGGRGKVIQNHEAHVPTRTKYLPFLVSVAAQPVVPASEFCSPVPGWPNNHIFAKTNELYITVSETGGLIQNLNIKSQDDLGESGSATHHRS